MVALTGGMFWSGHVTPRLGIDLAGGTSITLQAKNTPGKPNAINKTNMDTAVNIIDRRVNGLGVSEAEVQTQGDKNIIVNIPKGTNSKQAQDQVGTTAQLFFRPVLTYAPGTPTAPEPAAQHLPERLREALGERQAPGGQLEVVDAEPVEHHPGPGGHGRAQEGADAHPHPRCQ